MSTKENNLRVNQEYYPKSQEKRALLGFEPSGVIHLGHYLILKELMNYQKKGAEIVVILGDLHAVLNSKKNVTENTRRMTSFLNSFEPKIKIVKATDFVKDEKYWQYFLQFANNINFNTVFRGLPLIEKLKKNETIKLFSMPFNVFLYPLFQIIDGHYLQADLLVAGIDQKNIYMPILDHYQKLAWPKPSIHLLPLISLKGTVSTVEDKMSSSRLNIPLDHKLYKTTQRYLKGEKTFLKDLEENELHKVFRKNTFTEFIEELKKDLEPVKDFSWTL